MKLYLTLFMLIPFWISAQTTQEAKPKDKKISFSVWDGCVIVGYVDKGAYLNLGGPNIKWKMKSVSITAGLLPSLRFKKDNNEIKNSVVTPTLGFGLTCSYKHFIVQVPIFYNGKTAAVNGKWNSGVGIGYKF